MKNAYLVTDELQRSLAVVQRNLFQQSSPLASVGRFDLVRTLGSGGMGVVYEAFDREHGERVALKMLNGHGPAALYRLKREFRSLAAISHNNLVALYELHVCEQHAFFTMELLTGCDLLSHFAQLWSTGAQRELGSLRGVLTQLCRGLIALHDEGKVHSDLKPSNVIVTEHGRVVLVDFGMASEPVARSAEIAGTPRYMAPERFRGRVSEAGDWYSFGRTLQQLLELARHHGNVDEPVADLQLLAELLLQPDPSQRPRAADVLRTVSGDRAKWSRSGERPGAFVGRHMELSILESAFARSRKRPGLVVLRGEAGVGKTALMTHFANDRRAKARAVVISGRCYQHEFVAFKALDGVIDELSRQLAHGAEHWLVQLSPSERSALIQVFPVLGRLFGSALEPAAQEAIHPVAARNRGFSALKRLLAIIASEYAVILCIDDLHWSDEDSACLLSSLLCDEDSPALLVIATDRAPAGAVNPLSEELARASASLPRPADCVELTLTNLSHAETLALAQALGRGGARYADQELARFAAASLGSPLLLTELLRSSELPLVAKDGARRAFDGSLDAIIGARVAALDPPTRRLLCLVAIAGRPITKAVVEHALSLGHAQRNIVRDLCRARLIRATHRGAELTLTVEHDRIGEAVLRQLSSEERRELHARLAGAFDAHDAFAAEGSLAQYLAAGLRERAAERALEAGELALAALAFARAAWLFERALELGTWSGPARMHLHAELATAQAHAGKGALAAAAYFEAARLCRDRIESVRLQTLAAEQLMIHGRYAQGLSLLKGCYELVGLRWPNSRLELVIRLLFLLGSAELSGLFRRGTPSQGAQHQARVQLFSLAGTCLEGFDDERALYNALLMLREAQFSPEPVLRARALGLRGFMRTAAILRGGRRRGVRDLQAAYEIASAHGDLGAMTDVQRQLAASHYVNGNARAAVQAGLRCTADLRIHPLPPRDLYRALGVTGASLLALGEVREAERFWREFSDMARNQTDAATNFWLHMGPPRFMLLLIADDRDGARVMLQRQAQVCAQHPCYWFMRWAHAHCLVEAAIYFQSGESALREVEERYRALSRTRYPLMSTYADYVLARALLTAASERAPERRAPLLRRAEWALMRLRLLPPQEPVRSCVNTLRAGLAMLRGRRDRAEKHLQRSLATFEEQGATLHAASTRYQLGSMLQGSEGERLRASARAELDARGVVACERWLRWSLPGFHAAPAHEPARLASLDLALECHDS